jgi:hypothetical protein
MKLKPISIAAALALIAGGFMVGRISTSEADSAQVKDLGAARGTRSSSRELADSSEKKVSTRATKRDTSVAEAGKNRLARLDAIMQGESPLDRNRALIAFVDQLAPGDFEGVVAHFRSLGITDERRGEYALLLGAWAEVNPTAALAYAKENTQGNFAKDTILTTWANRDPEAAIQWANTQFSGDGANPYLPGIIRALAVTDATRAYELLSRMPMSTQRAEGLDYMLPHILRQGADAARAWIAAIKDDSLRNGAMLRAAEGLAELEPAATAQFLIDQPSEATQRRLDNVYSIWGKKNLTEAMSSYQSLAPGTNRSLALSGLIGTVTVDSPEKGLALMDQNAADIDDQVVQRYIWHSFGKNPQLAASQISRIQEPETQDRMYRRALKSWIEEDAASAQAWIQSNPLPQSVTDYLARNAANPP